jgi:cytochrome c
MIRKTFILAPAAVLLACATMLPAQNAAHPDGSALFRQRCGSCHSVAPSQRAVLAPNLAGVVGRKAGSTSFTYSPALKNSNLTWTRANLDRFLTAPARMVPGTRMVVMISDAQQRAAVLDFLTRPTP